jgi:hypothetical protein
MPTKLIFAASTLALSALGCTAEVPSDVGSRVEAVCCGANCCNVGGDCFMRGDRNPLDTCQECDPSSSQSAFTDIAGCVDGGPPPVADGGPSGTDSGPSGSDSGPSGSDSGPSGSDSGPSGSDSGPSGSDAGPPPSGGGGGGCTAASGRAGGALALMILGLGALAAARRRR